MSNPSFDNIDKWLFEYMEGNLSPAQVTQLESFLLNNPEFEPDLDAWQMAKADARPVVYPGVVGRTRKPIPFWITATTILTAVFVAGGFFGSFLTTQTADSTKIQNPVSAANTPEYRLFNVSGTLSSIEKQEADFSNDGLFLDKSRNSLARRANNSTFNSSRVARIPTFAPNVHQQKREMISVDSGDLKNLVPKESELISNSADDIVTIDHKSVIQEEGVKEIIKDSENGLNEIVIADNTNELNSNADQNANEDNTDSNGNGVDPSTTAKAMTRGSNRISSNYNHSFSNKLKSTMRKIARMTDNPIALTNSKDIYYHVPNMQTLNVNAATAGNLLRPRIQTISRAQWTGHSNQQILNELSFDTYVRSIRGGIGVQLNHAYYNQGTYNVGQIALTYSPKLSVNRNFSIEPAIRIKMGDKRLNAQNLVPGQLIEMERGNEHIFYNETPQNLVKDLWYKDVALALNTNTKWFSAGFQMDNIGRHHNNVYNSFGQNDRAGIHYTANLGTDFVSRSKIISFSPYIMYQKVENLSEIWGGSIFRYKNWTIGGAYSSTGDYAGSFGLKTKNFMLTYNADMTRSVLTDSRLFSSQLTMRILMNKGRYGRTMLKQ